MIRTELTRKLSEAVFRLQASGKLHLPADFPEPELSEPRSAEHGDFATNYALVATKAAKMTPPALGAMLAEEMQNDDAFESAESAGPGFVNLRLTRDYIARWAAEAFQSDSLLAVEECDPQKILIEFVSVNPNGPIHLGHARGAAYGDTLARVLKAAGHEVWREYYVNDGVNSKQMQLFALSVKAMYRKSLGLPFDFPEDGYKGESVEEVAEQLRKDFGDGHAEDGINFFQPASQRLMLAQQEKDLARFGITYDEWFSEQSLHESGEVGAAIEQLRKLKHAYDQDGAIFLKSSDFGDDKDRCVIRSTGEPTYIASDIAYHKDKFDRGFDHLINVWGPDHHGYVVRTLAAVEALGYPKERLELIITQIVRFIQDGKPAPMRKRNGEFYRLSDLMDELGVDVVRYFFLMRSADTHMDFDLDLAREHSEKNPMFYAQYAHARICSLIKKAEEQGFSADVANSRLLGEPAERELIKKIWDLPFEVGRAAEDRGVHRLTTYSLELARQYHNFYDRCPVIKAETKELASARLVLCEAARKAFRETFQLLGISAPESM